MLALQNLPIIHKPAKPLIRFARHLLSVANTDRFSPEAIALRALTRNSAYCVALGGRGGNQRYLLSDEGLKSFRLAVRENRKAALVDIAHLHERAYTSRVHESLTTNYGESPKEAAHFIASNDLALCEWREEGISPEIVARLLFDDIREIYTCPDCGCDLRHGWHQQARGYHNPSYECGGERRCW